MSHVIRTLETYPQEAHCLNKTAGLSTVVFSYILLVSVFLFESVLNHPAAAHTFT